MLAAYGLLLNKNTLETFKNCNKIALLEELGQELWQSITSGEAMDNPALLSRFFLLTFAVSTYILENDYIDMLSSLILHYNMLVNLLIISLCKT